MKKNIFLTAMALLVSSATFAGGLLTNTNQNVAFLRNPARDAVIAIDGVYSNPAGVAFLPKGFHLSLNWQAAWQKREMISSAPFYGFNQNNKGITENGLTYNKYVGTASAPVIPSFQAAYVINDKWSVSAQFAVGGGGGKCEFDNGLPMFEQLVGGQMASTIAGSVPYSYSLNQNLTGEQYFYGIQVGATYKIGKHVSVFAGARGIIAKSGYEGAISNITVNGNGASVYATQMNQAIAAAQQFAAAGDLANAQYYQTLATKAGTAAAIMSDYNLDCQQSGLGITPILGVDVNLGKLNLAAKYEFRTKIELENESSNTANVDALMPAYADGAKVRSDIPALLTLGAQYSVMDNFRLMGGFHYYFDKDAKGSATNVAHNTWEVTFGTEYDVNKWLTLSCGGQRTKYNFGSDMQDTNFNISSYGLCLGAKAQLCKVLAMNIGYMHSFYGDKTINRGNNIIDRYTRKNDVVGISLDFKF
ncbi:MAG: outer membrane beta-barrel protein [Paraprevotella sp.]|jgi:long-chain fatty acid transport protein|nr:outer membrane beta-barrel protein [Paraprevotella sp.]